VKAHYVTQTQFACLRRRAHGHQVIKVVVVGNRYEAEGGFEDGKDEQSTSYGKGCIGQDAGKTAAITLFSARQLLFRQSPAPGSSATNSILSDTFFHRLIIVAQCCLPKALILSLKSARSNSSILSFRSGHESKDTK